MQGIKSYHRLFFGGLGGDVKATMYTGAYPAHTTEVLNYSTGQQTAAFSGRSSRPSTRYEGTTRILGFIKEWSIEVTAEIIGADTFGNNATTNMEYGGLMVWKDKSMLGFHEAKVEITGYAIQSAIDPAKEVYKEYIRLGHAYWLTLVFRQTTDSANMPDIESYDRLIEVDAICTSVSYSNPTSEPVEFKAEFEVVGGELPNVVWDRIGDIDT